jgi:hypothetical protein
MALFATEKTGDDLVRQYEAAVEQFEATCGIVSADARERRAVVQARLAGLEAEESVLTDLISRKLTYDPDSINL